MIEVLIAAVPLLLLLGALLLGHYPGCDAIVRLSERISAAVPDSSSAPPAVRRPVPPRSFAPGGGLLIAFSLAQRPPPLAP
jgi:hypothetical protein